MLSKWWKLFVAVFCAALFSQASAGTINPRVAKSDVCGPYEILHVNGINTTIEGARENLRELSVRFGNAHEEHLIRYGLAYNQTDWLLADLRQTYSQLLASYPGVSFRQWLRAVFSGIWPESLPAEAVAEIAGTLGTLMGLNRPSPYYDTDLNRMISEIRAFHRQDGRMVLVGHSQGTIYANFLYDRMTSPPLPIMIPADRLAIVGVAAVTENLRGGGGHVNSQRDMVVNLARLVAPNTLAANVTLPQFAPDILGHNFIAVYLAYLPSREAIVGRIETALTSLASSAASPVWQGSYPPTLYSQVRWWTLCSPTQPCWRYIGLPVRRERFEEPVVEWQVPGQGYGEAQVGSLSDAINKAYENAQLCYELARDQMISVRAAGNMNQWFFVPGCGQTVGHPLQGVWFAYSGDGPPVFRHTHYPQSYEVITTVGATCRQGAGT